MLKGFELWNDARNLPDALGDPEPPARVLYKALNQIFSPESLDEKLRLRVYTLQTELALDSNPTVESVDQYGDQLEGWFDPGLKDNKPEGKGQRIKKKLFLDQKTIFLGKDSEPFWRGSKRNFSGSKTNFLDENRCFFEANELLSQPASQPAGQGANRHTGQPAGQLAANQANPLEPSLGHLMPRNLRK
jgi:hypothetical protein